MDKSTNSRGKKLDTLTNQDVTREFFKQHEESDYTIKIDRKWRMLGKLSIRDLSGSRVR